MRATKQSKFACLILLILCIPFLLAWPKVMDTTMRSRDQDASVIVLNYHKIDIADTALAITAKDFEDQIIYLKEHGYTTISPDELVDFFESGIPLPDKSVLITFDDGYLDNYTNAYPILKKYGMKATVFIITDYLGLYPNYINWEQAKEMSGHGIHIASHTMQHKPLTELSDEVIRQELIGSAEAIAAHIGKPAKCFAYPTGAYDLRIAGIVKECGYRAAFTIKYGNVDNASNLYSLERVPIFKVNDTMAGFKDRIKYLPFYERLGIIKT